MDRGLQPEPTSQVRQYVPSNAVYAALNDLGLTMGGSSHARLLKDYGSMTPVQFKSQLRYHSQSDDSSKSQAAKRLLDLLGG